MSEAKEKYYQVRYGIGDEVSQVWEDEVNLDYGRSKTIEEAIKESIERLLQEPFAKNISRLFVLESEIIYHEQITSSQKLSFCGGQVTENKLNIFKE